MAVTSLWPVKSRLRQVIDYARNPEKTTEAGFAAQAALHAIDGVVEYAADTVKTERRSYVTCLHCTDEEHAAAEFWETKQFWRKTGGRLCFHGYQSFQADEVDAETAHEIGVKLARTLWGDRFQVVVATHCNTGHYHNHFVLNSVSFVDGRHFDNRPEDYRAMREASDALCREYGLSVIREPRGRGKQYSEWAAERNGKPTHRGMIRADIDRAVAASTTERGFMRVMQEMGYAFKTHGKNGAPLKYPALKPPDADRFFRFHSLGEGYALEEIRERILRNLRKEVPFPTLPHRAPRRCRVRGTPRKITGLRALYFRYCYELHILIKKPASVKRVSFLLREDVIKLDRLDAQTRFLGKHKISTMDELMEYRSSTSDRREVILCDEIAQRSSKVKENLERLLQQKETERRELTQDELFRRRSRTSRAHELRDG